MTRPSRDEARGAIHHVIPQGNGRRAIVDDDHDRRAYLTRFARLRRELGWLEHAGCLMDTHHHAVVETAEPNLAVGMQRLQGGHSRWLNARHGREGQVFRHRFWSRRILDDGWLLRACIYVVVNPVAAGLCGHPGEWPWSSYRATAYGDPNAYAPGESRLLGLFGETPGEARRSYRQVVDAAVEVVTVRRYVNAKAVWTVLDELDGSCLPQVSG